MANDNHAQYDWRTDRLATSRYADVRAQTNDVDQAAMLTDLCDYLVRRASPGAHSGLRAALPEPQRTQALEWIHFGDAGEDERADDAIVKLTSATGRAICSLNAAWLKAAVSEPATAAPNLGPGSTEDERKALLQLVDAMPILTPQATGLSHAMRLVLLNALRYRDAQSTAGEGSRGVIAKLKDDNGVATLITIIDEDGDGHLRLVDDGGDVSAEFCTRQGGGQNPEFTTAVRHFIGAVQRASTLHDGEEE